MFSGVLFTELLNEMVLISNTPEAKVPQAWHIPSHGDDEILIVILVDRIWRVNKIQSVQSLHVDQMAHPSLR
jgi:hypothetical protein